MGAVPAGPLHLRLPQRPGDARYPQEAVVADGRRGAADVAGERAAEEVQRHEARARSVAAAAILREREANHLLHALSVSVCCSFIIPLFIHFYCIIIDLKEFSKYYC